MGRILGIVGLTILAVLFLVLLLIRDIWGQSTSTVTFNIVQTLGPFSTPMPSATLAAGQCSAKTLSVPGANPANMHIAWGINQDLTKVAGFMPSQGAPLTWANPFLAAGTATFTVCNYTTASKSFGGATIFWSIQAP